MKKINLTIVTAIHDRFDGLLNVIDCLDKQTYGNDFEHILVDDCSTEISYQQLEELCKDNDHRHFIRLGFRTHFYGCFARDIGILTAFSYFHHSVRDIDNEWIMLADTDNQWTPDHIQTMVETIEQNPEATMIGCDMKMVGVNDPSWEQIRPCTIKHTGCDLGSFFYKTSLFRKYGYFFAHPRRKQKYDYDLIKKIADGEGDKLVFTHKLTFIMSYRKK